MDFMDREDVAALLYVTSGQSGIHSLRTYKELLLDEKWAKKEQVRLAAESELLAQYQRPKEDVKGEDNEETQTLESIIATLVAGGISPEWLYNEMELCDLPALLDAHTRAERSRLEEERLFTTISILPHVKGIRNPKQVLSFPWEKEMNEKEMTVDEQKAAEAIFDDFKKNGLKYK